MTSDVHIETILYVEDDNSDRPIRHHLAQLREAPGFLLSRVEGAHDISTYVLFPHISVPSCKFKALSQERMARWGDGALTPAMHRYYPAHYNPHLPSSYLLRIR